MKTKNNLITVGCLALLAAGFVARPAAAQHTIGVEVPAEDGHLEYTSVPAPPPVTELFAATALADVQIIQETGQNANRIDFVFVGDGYTASELDQYHDDVAGKWEELMTIEPFSTYRSYFNAYQVDVISNQSGVDHDPTQGVLKDTELNMGFWCSGIERLLCVDVSAARTYAENAPAVEHVIALANSSKYGGAGYRWDDLATASGSNVSSGRVVVHELGHSLGNLEDEYVRDTGHYSGSEVADANLSIYEASQMADLSTKWYRWLGETTPDGGTIGTFEGGALGDTGIYRPSSSSMMRSLNSPFNLPGLEALVVMIYADVSPIDDSTPTDNTLNGSEIVFVQPMAPEGQPLTITWNLDGTDLPLPSDQATLDLSDLSLSGSHTLTVTVVDETPLVRDPQARSELLTDTRTWSIDASGNGGGNACDEFGIAYVDDSTLAVFHRDQGWSAAWHYLCLDGYCVSGTPSNGYYFKEFAGTIGTTYDIDFKTQDDAQGQFIASGRESFTADNCRLDAPACGSAADCDDGLSCNGQEQCIEGSCQAGEPIVCDDGVPCTVDSCSEQAGCVFEPDHTWCDNGLFCDGQEQCDPTLGECTAGLPPCGTDDCDETSDSCGSSGDCGEFGIAHEDANTLVVYHEDRGWTGSWHYLCLNGYCVPGTLSNGYYQRSFGGNLGTTYSIEFKIQDNATGQFIARGQDTFTTECCTLPAR